MITLYIIGAMNALTLALCAILLAQYRRQKKMLELLVDFSQVGHVYLQYQNDATELILWKSMTDLYHSKAAATNAENYEMAEQYKNAIDTIEHIITFYRQTLKANVQPD